jgi:hypothetical protein
MANAARDLRRALERIKGLEGEAYADEERLRKSADDAGILYVGCDTPEALVDRIKQLESELSK